MRKLIFLSVIIFISSSYSQTIKGYGIKAGGTLSIQENEMVPGKLFTSDDYVGFNVGAFAELFDVPVFSLVTEMNYIQKGFKGNLSDMYYRRILSWKEKIHYLNVSLLAKTRLESEIFSIYLLLGPRVDFKLGESNNSAESPGFDFKNYLMGLKIGLGAEINLSVTRMLTEFIYDYGFEDVDNKKNIKFNSFDFRIGVYL